jgi:DNA invertase Pin-like site-specific DNA recombinase
MREQASSTKITSSHLNRKAYVYIRQSTMYQVRYNTSSTLQQYDWVGRARELGWNPENIVVVDQDQAHSATTTDGRDGFKRMLSDIALGNAGAVITEKDDRLARDGYAWQRLLRFCEIMETIIIDKSGIYDPRIFEDRMVLGLKGVFSEAEWRVNTERMLSAKIRKAKDGQLRFKLPTGYIHDENGKIILDPNEEVQSVIRLVFSMFEESNSCQMMVKRFNSEKILFPTRISGVSNSDSLRWSYLTCDRALDILHNVVYAGVYPYGRTKSSRHIVTDDPSEVKKRSVRLKIEDWTVLIHDSHVGYITWDQFLINQQRIEANSTQRTASPGATREGKALLQGIAMCGKCGRKMKVMYRKGKNHPIYYCNGRDLIQAEKRVCQQLSFGQVDQAVEQIFLNVIAPAELGLSISIFKHVAAQSQYVERQRDLGRQRVQYEADLAYRRYAAVDPDNRLVVRNLERMWNEKLAEVERFERESVAASKNLLPLGPEEERTILNLKHDLTKVWRGEIITSAERKQLLRCVIRNVELTRIEATVLVNILWQTNSCTLVEVPLLATPDYHRTDQKLLDLIRELAPVKTVNQVADYLNEAGFVTAENKSFDKYKLWALKFSYKLPKFLAAPRGVRQYEKGRCGIKKAAQLLNRSPNTVRRMCHDGRLDAIHSNKHEHWQIKLTRKTITALRRPPKSSSQRSRSI